MLNPSSIGGPRRAQDGAELKICSRCIYDSNVSGINFDNQGVCNLCYQVDRLRADYGVGEEKGKEALRSILERIKVAGRGKRYDCIIGVSGGTD